MFFLVKIVCFVIFYRYWLVIWDFESRGESLVCVLSVVDLKRMVVSTVWFLYYIEKNRSIRLN